MRPLLGSHAILACFVAALVLVLGTEAGAVVFDDGQVHVIDTKSFPAEVVDLFDGPDGVRIELVQRPQAK